MVSISNAGVLVQPSSVAIFAQPPGVGFVPFLLTQVNIPSPTRVRFDLAETEDLTRRWTVPRNPLERLVGQNRIREPDELTLTGMLSANPLFSPLSLAGAARLDKRELIKLKTIVENSLSFIVTPERPYKDMACVEFRETYDDTTGNGVRLSMRFQEIRVAIPGLVEAETDLDTLGLGASATDNLGPQTPTDVVDPGGLG